MNVQLVTVGLLIQLVIPAPAARNSVRVRRISAFALGEWPSDPGHARAV